MNSTRFGVGIGYTQNGSEHFMSTFPMLVVDRMRVLTSQFKSTPHVGMGIGCMNDGSEHFKQQLYFLCWLWIAGIHARVLEDTS